MTKPGSSADARLQTYAIDDDGMPLALPISVANGSRTPNETLLVTRTRPVSASLVVSSSTTHAAAGRVRFVLWYRAAR